MLIGGLSGRVRSVGAQRSVSQAELPMDSFEAQKHIPPTLIPATMARSSRLQRSLSRSIERFDLPSQGVAVLGPSSTEVAIEGALKAEGGRPVDENSKFHLGSCTKMMTAAMLARLVEKEQLSWSSTVSDVFAEFAQTMHPNYRDVTLEQLTSHRSGLPDNFDGRAFKKETLIGYVNDTTTRRELTREALSGNPFSQPGTKFHYSNVGYVVAAAMAEEVTGQSWESLMKQEIFEPLGMSDSGFGPAGEEHPWGHNQKGDPVSPSWDEWRAENPRWWKEGLKSQMPDNPPLMGPAGTVHSTLSDWSKFIRAQAERDTDFLSTTSWDFLQSPREGWDYTPGGWQTTPIPGIGVGANELYHDGSNKTFHSWVRLKRDDGENPSFKAVLAVSNQPKGDANFQLSKEQM